MIIEIMTFSESSCQLSEFDKSYCLLTSYNSRFFKQKSNCVLIFATFFSHSLIFYSIILYTSSCFHCYFYFFLFFFIYIHLGNHVSIQLTVSVAHPRSLPQCHLLGSSHLTAPLNTRLTNNYNVSFISSNYFGE